MIVEGATKREHYRRTERPGYTPDELVPPDYCYALRYLWLWYCELNQARQGNGFGMNLLTYSEIDAWARLTQRCLAVWEVQVLKSLDVLNLSVKK